MIPLRTSIPLLAASGLLSAAAAAQQASFAVLPIPQPFIFSKPVLSGDGSTVFALAGGWGTPPVSYRWRATGLEIIPPTATWNEPILPYDSSTDGAIMVGGGGGGVAVGIRTARWIQGTGTENLHPPLSHARACSADGSILAGGWIAPSAPNEELYFWSAGARLHTIFLPPGFPHGYLIALSADGTVAAGTAYTSSLRVAFRWTSAGGTVVLPDMGSASAISLDGNVIVSVGGPHHRWTALGSIAIPGMESASAAGGHGWVIGGIITLAPGEWASVIWDPIRGSRRLEAALLSFGITIPAGLHQLKVTDISDDGRILIGRGVDAQGSELVWIATIPFCYANCDGSSAAPALNIADFSCFIRKFAQNDIYANCNNDGSVDVTDFACFLQSFTAGCP